jgi:hypothetical protein
MHRRQFLLKQIDDKIEVFQRESTRHKHFHRRMRYAAFGLTAASTVLASLALTYPVLQAELNLGVVLVSASLGVVTSLEGLHKASDLWLHERGMFLMLLDLKRELEFEYPADAAPNEQLEKKYFDRLQRLLTVSSEKWKSEIARNSADSAKDDGAADGKKP